jgi:hypothetical protein
MTVFCPWDIQWRFLPHEQKEAVLDEIFLIIRFLVVPHTQPCP